jgi:hypothetical protein
MVKRPAYNLKIEVKNIEKNALSLICRASFSDRRLYTWF